MYKLFVATLLVLLSGCATSMAREEADNLHRFNTFNNSLQILDLQMQNFNKR